MNDADCLLLLAVFAYDNNVRLLRPSNVNNSHLLQQFYLALSVRHHQLNAVGLQVWIIVLNQNRLKGPTACTLPGLSPIAATLTGRVVVIVLVSVADKDVPQVRRVD